MRTTLNLVFLAIALVAAPIIAVAGPVGSQPTGPSASGQAQARNPTTTHTQQGRYPSARSSSATMSPTGPPDTTFPGTASHNTPEGKCGLWKTGMTMDTNETYGPENATYTVIELNSTIDGKTIEIGLSRPLDPQTGEPLTDVPVILIATPYSGDMSNNGPGGFDCIPKGYAYAVVSVRGTGGSGGCWNAMGPAERRDIDQAISYLGEATWSNGSVGMIGISYDGSTPWEAAAMGNTHLETIVPADGVTRLGGWAQYRNKEGEINPLLYGGTAVYGGFESFFIGSPIFGTSNHAYASRVTCQHEAVEGTYAQTYGHLTGEDTGGYWAARNFRRLVLRNYDGSILITHGLRDYNVKSDQIYPFAKRLEADEDIEVRYMLGQWGHDWPNRNDWAQIVMDHFDHELKGEPAPQGPDAYIQDTTGEWRSESTWPPERAYSDTWYLHPNGSLARTPTTETDSQIIGGDVSTQPNGSTVPGCGACAVFETDRFEQAYRFAGQPRLNVTATPTGPGGYLTTHVYVVQENGTRNHLSTGMVRLAYGDGGESADMIVPGHPVNVSVPILPQDVKINEDSKLVVVLSQRGRSAPIGLYPFPVEVHLGNGSATFNVQTFNATSD